MPLGHIDPPNSSEHAILIFSEDYSMTTTIYAHKHVNQDGTAPESGQYVVGDPNHAPTVIVYEGTASGPTVATIVYKGRLRGFRAGLIHFSGKPPILFKRWMTRAGSRGGEHRLNIAGEDYVWTGARKNVLQVRSLAFFVKMIASLSRTLKAPERWRCHRDVYPRRG